jgi:hypothetical protein
MKKYAYFAILSLMCCACSPQLRQLAPNHLGVTPSCEWEIQEGHNVKHKPKIQTSLDWNF